MLNKYLLIYCLNDFGWEVPGCNLQPAPLLGGQGETKGAGYTKWVGGRFNEQRNLHMKPVMGKSKTLDPCTCLPNR